MLKKVMTKMMKKSVFFSVFLVLCQSSSFAAETKIGVYDMQEVVNTTADGKKAQQELEKMFASRKKEVEDKEKELSKLMDSLEKQKLVLSSKAYEEKARDLQSRGNDFLQQKMNAEMELKKKDLELRSKLFGKVRAVVEKIGRQGKYTAILEKGEGGVVYFVDNIDLTKKIIEEYNKAYAGK